MLLVELFPYLIILLLVIMIPKFFSTNHYLLLLFFLLALFAGCRYGVGWDYFNYTRAIDVGGYEMERVEFFPRQIELLAHNVLNPQLFFIITSFLIVLCYFIAFKELSIDPAISIFAFFCIPIFYLTSLTTIRFSLAVAIFFLSSIYVNKNKLFFIGLLLLVFLTHKAGLIGLLVIPFLVFKWQLNLFWNILIFILCFTLSRLSIVSSILTSVFDVISINWGELGDIAEYGRMYIENAQEQGFSKSPYLYAFINICNLVNYSYLKQKDIKGNVALYITLYNIGCSLMFLFSFDQTYASRLAQFFMVFILLLIPYYKYINIFKYIMYSVLLFAFMYQLSIIGFHPDFIGRRNCFLPYQLFFNKL